MPSFAYDVFLSHNTAQKDWTRDLARRLRDEGLDVWFDEWCLRAGENWIVGLRRGVNESRHVVFVVSPESIDAVWPRFQVYLAIFLDRAADDRRLIPIVHTPCDLPDEIALRQCIDFSETHVFPLLYEFKFQQLMANLDPSRERPTDFQQWREQVGDKQLEALPPVGPLPRGSVMPLGPNACFVGRADELRQLESHLRPVSVTSTGQMTVATGLPGIGKTQLAVEYAHRFGRRYPGGVFWLDMENPRAIASQVAAYGGPEGMDVQGFDSLSLEQQVARVKREWEDSTRRLLIFDHVDDPEVVQQWRPVSGGCRVLLTSRRTEWPSTLGLEEVRLATLPRDKAIELLCKGRREALEYDGEKEAADAICEILGDLPLALALTGSYLGFYKHHVTLAQFLRELRAEPVLENPALVDFVRGPSPTHHIQNVAATFEMSYRRLDPEVETDALAMRLFHLAPHFAPVSISRELLSRAAGLKLDVDEDQRRAAAAIRRLTGLGLIQHEAKGRLLLHPLLAEFGRGRARPDEQMRDDWEAVAHTLLCFAREQNEGGLPKDLARELAHLTHVATEAERRGWAESSQLHSELGYHLWMVASYDDARAQYERALAIDETALGRHDPMVARSLTNLGNVLLDIGDATAAREHYERALTISRDALGPEDPYVGTVISNLASALRSLGDLEGARMQYEQAVRLWVKVLGPAHPQVGAALNNLGLVLQDIGRLDEAREHLERALATWETTLGPEHPQVAAALGNLGMVLQDMGRVEQALACLHRALVIDVEFFGYDHPKTATDLNRLGGAYRRIGRLESALDYLEHALLVDIQSLGPEHPDVARDHADLGQVLLDIGQLDSAREHFDRALGIWERALGTRAPEVAEAARTLGDVLHKSGDLVGAQAQYERALAIHEDAHGPQHESVAVDLNYLGGVLTASGNVLGALSVYQRALDILNRIGAENTPVARLVLNNIGALREMDSSK